MSLSARRAWIEIGQQVSANATHVVALRKESVDRNAKQHYLCGSAAVALRKESVDRNAYGRRITRKITLSLSARRAWIEILPKIIVSL